MRKSCLRNLNSLVFLDWSKFLEVVKYFEIFAEQGLVVILNNICNCKLLSHLLKTSDIGSRQFMLSGKVER